MIFQGHHRSYILAPLYTLGMVSYLSLTVAMGLTCTVFLQKAIESHLDMTFQGHHRSYLLTLMETLGMISYLSFIFTMTNRHRFPSKGYWKSHDLDMTFQGHHRSYMLAPLYTLGMVSYLSLIVTMCLTGTVFLQKAIQSHMTLTWPSKVVTGHICWHYWRPWVWFPICHSYSPCA